MPYSDPSLIYDETAVAEDALAGVAGRIDGWAPANGDPETSFAEAVAVAITTAAIQVRDQLKERYANGFGRDVLGLERNAAVSALAAATWTFTTTDPVTVPGGTEVDGLNPDGNNQTFVVAADTLKPTGVTTIDTTLVALFPGADSNDVAGDATSDFVGPDNNPVISVEFAVPSSNGADEEDRDAWITRIRKAARRLHAVPITPADHADIALEVAGISRAHVRNRYDPAHPTDDTAFHTSIWALDSNGAPVSGGVKTALLALLNGYDRPYGITYHAVDAASLTLTVAAQIQTDDGADDDAVTAAARVALLAATNPAQFDADIDAPGGYKTPSTTLTAFDLSAAIDDIPGLRRVLSLTINGGASVTLTAPLTLPALADDHLTLTVV